MIDYGLEVYWWQLTYSLPLYQWKGLYQKGIGLQLNSKSWEIQDQIKRDIIKLLSCYDGSNDKCIDMEHWASA